MLGVLRDGPTLKLPAVPTDLLKLFYEGKSNKEKVAKQSQTNLAAYTQLKVGTYL